MNIGQTPADKVSFTVGSGAVGTGTATWNGGWCGTCGSRYLGSHYCQAKTGCASCQVKQAVIDALMTALSSQNPPKIKGDFGAAGCGACDPARGGSGVCNCVLGGPRVTC